MVLARILAVAASLLCGLALGGPAAAQTLEQMAGQMIIVGFQGTAASDKSVAALRQQIAAGELGGIMYLKTNVASLAAVKEMNDAFLAANPSMKPFITIDQEGGMVERLTKDVDFKEVPTAANVAETMSVEQAAKVYSELARSLASLGFNVNFGPVADVDVNPNNPVIAKFGRAFSNDPGTVIDYDQAFIRAHEGAGVLTALKHFPGHGSSTTDSHDGFVDISKTWSEFVDLLPFSIQLGGGYQDFVMVGHLYHEKYSGDAGKLPASLSRDWIEGMLRRNNGNFDGVVITDDLEMGAIRKLFSLEETVKMAVMAGVDVLLFSNTAKYTPDLAANVRQIIVDAAKADPAFEQRVRQSFGRIQKLKLRLALIQKLSCNCAEIPGCGETRSDCPS